MNVLSIDIGKHLTSTFFDPSPHRFKENEQPVSLRRVPIVYECENCGYKIAFKNEDFEKHSSSSFSNLDKKDKELMDKECNILNINNMSFLDFLCPKCKQPSAFYFLSGPSGYGGTFEFYIKYILVIKK